MEKIYDIAIIGGGPGGIYASFLGDIKGLSTILIEAGEYLGGQPLTLFAQKQIFDFPGQYGVKGHELISTLVDQLTQHSKTPIMLGTRLLKFERNDEIFTLTLSNGESIFCKRIIIAIGGGLLQPLRLEIPGSENNKKIEYTVRDFKNYENKKVIILGGGDSAVDWANELAKRQICQSVTIIHRRDALRAKGDNVDNLKINKVEILLNSTPTKISGSEIEISNNDNQEIKTLQFDSLIVQYGQKIDNSNNDVFSSIKRNEQNRILVAENQMTNIDGVYAIGNICYYKNKPSSIIASHGEAARAIKDTLNTLNKYDKY